MANINMTYSELTDQASRLDQGRQEIQDKLNTMMSQVQNLISSGFVTDQASGAFGESYQQFTSGAAATIDGLQGMTAFLNQTAQAMADLDAQLAAGIKG